MNCSARPRRSGRRRLLSAALLASLSLPAGAQTVAETGNIADKVEPCTACHGKAGRVAPDGYYPPIAGKPVAYLYNQLINFREGLRSHPAMNHLVAVLPNPYLHEMAAYFAGQAGETSAPAAALNANPARRAQRLIHRGDPARALPACTACHGQALAGMLPATPALIGLPRDYLMAQLGAWASKQRRAAAPDCMADIAAALSGAEIGAVAAWLAAQPVPADISHAPQADTLPLPCGSYAGATTGQITGAPS